LKYSIDPKIFTRYPGFIMSVIAIRGLNNTGSNQDITSLLSAAQQSVRDRYQSTEQLGDEPKITCWREAYRAFGAKPSKYRCSIEALCRRLIKSDDQLSSINPLVDIYNIISLNHTLSIGGDDTDLIDGNMQLTFADGTEEYRLLGGTEVAEGLEPSRKEHPKPGEVIYRDDIEVLCRRFNWRESDKSKMTEETKNAVLFIEGLPPITETEINEATSELVDLIQQHCGGEITTHILNKQSSSAEF
jgi:DNA/RNA-binding domain of Phe-tRNA-synthetase-like protein